MTSDPNASPINPLPPIVVALSVFLVGVELVFQAGNVGFVGGPEATGWRLQAVERWGFYEPLFNWMVENRQIRWDYLMRFVTYPFVHQSFTHIAFVLVFLLALGKLVGEIFNAWAVLIIFFGASIFGALVYGLVWDTRVMLFGGYPAVYGLIGSYSFLLFVRLTGTGENRLMAFRLIAFLMAIQLVFSLFTGGSPDWVADVAGFAAGFGLSFLVAPGGWSHVLAVLRRR
ncbi:rhomboid family intramembrane serine protease [Aliiroseovarius subalbicans]|uniref:rhomboid family intramembrane serine protease n=1 Tax=Aliiroseovarius subalbicans TaxID=2925840 RepID=UPI001F56D8CE|nr:rhomboid family intramembrane serine protease [Aliiroseovarius subalbicans]MCI2399398.1 rhomboid family intramembrane serine protease [Aliiroseovarius subalbicans]